jgi:hypothetical protein
LRVGATKGLVVGRDRLVIQTSGRSRHRWFTEVPFVVARPVKGLFTTASAVRSAGNGARVTVGVSNPGFGVSLVLNGRRRQPVLGGRKRSVSLDADDGVRPGLNRIVVRVVDQTRGRYSQRRLRLRTPVDRPVAGAGASKRTQVRRTVRVSAANSVGAKGARLRYRWTIVKAPRGSRAKLLGATSVRPRFRPDRLGYYTLRVTVRAGAHSALISTDTTTVAAVPAAGPIGVPIDTIATQGTGSAATFGVRVGNQFYAQPTAADALQMVVLDRSTLALVSNASYTNDASGAAALLTAVQSLVNTELVIITRPSPAVTNIASGSSATFSLDHALGQIGVGANLPAIVNGPDQTGCTPGAGLCSAFSVIGIPGLPEGQAQINAGLRSLGVVSSGGGDLHGYLQPDLSLGASSGQNFTFVSTDRVPFDTGDPTADPATVTVGSAETGSSYPKTTYTSDSLQGAPGFFLVILDAGTLALIGQQTYLATDAGVLQLAQTLQGNDNPDSLIILRSINSVSGLSPTDPYVQLRAVLEQLGASQYYFEAVLGQYAQIGPADSGATGYPNPWTQVASALRNGSGRLAGLLGRDSNGQWYPAESSAPNPKDPTRPLAGSVAGIESLPPSTWPDQSTPAEQAVATCIAANIDSAGGLSAPIESNYTNQNLVNSWSSWATTITQPSYYATLTAAPGCSGLDQTSFNAVVGQLSHEFNDVPIVWAMIHNIQNAVVATGSGNSSSIQSVANGVITDVNAQTQSISYNPAAIVADLLWIVGSIPGPDIIETGANILGGAASLAGDTLDNSNGSNAFNTTVTTDADNYAQDVSARFQATILGLSQEGDILVSDWTKLQAVAANASDTANAAADWSWNTAQAAASAQGLNLAVLHGAWEALFPPVYSLYRLQAGTVPQAAQVTQYQCSAFVESGNPTKPVALATWNPFTNAVTHAVVPVSGNFELWTYATASHTFLTEPPSFKGAQAVVPGKALGLQLFTTPPIQNPSAPLFNSPLQFDLEAYNNATTNTITVTHVSATDHKVNTDSICSTG